MEQQALPGQLVRRVQLDLAVPQGRLALAVQLGLVERKALAEFKANRVRRALRVFRVFRASREVPVLLAKQALPGQVEQVGLLDLKGIRVILELLANRVLKGRKASRVFREFRASREVLGLKGKLELQVLVGLADYKVYKVRWEPLALAVLVGWRDQVGQLALVALKVLMV
jgi:hypothetical protein